MKLYATTSSERASKGQGGNKDILVVITAEISGMRQEIFSVSVVNSDNGYYAIDSVNPEGRPSHYKISKGECLQTKGKQQKGEKCRKCGESHKDGIYHMCPDNQ